MIQNALPASLIYEIAPCDVIEGIKKPFQAMIGDEMNYSKTLSCMAILAAFLLIGATFGQDYLGGGYVGYGRTDDPGLAGMLQWLDQPVYSYPWYTAGGSFYSQPYSETTFSPYREYYTTTGTTTAGTKATGGIVSNPAKYDITGKTPSIVHYGAGVGLPYSQYASIAPSKTSDLWIQGTTNWTQYVVCPVGTWLQLIANAPAGGSAGFYEVVQTDTTATKYMIYQFNSGYNTMNYQADQAGRHMLYFVLNNQPSNVVVVDVFGQASGRAGVTYPAATQKPVNVLGKGGRAGSFTSGRSLSQTPYGVTTTTTTSDGRTITTTNGVTAITPPGQTVTTNDGTYQTTTSPDGTQTTTSYPIGTTVTTGDGQTTTTSSGGF